MAVHPTMDTEEIDSILNDSELVEAHVQNFLNAIRDPNTTRYKIHTPKEVPARRVDANKPMQNELGREYERWERKYVDDNDMFYGDKSCIAKTTRGVAEVWVGTMITEFQRQKSIEALNRE